MPSPKPLVFIVFDGWGVNPDRQYNAIAQANTPHWDALLAKTAHRTLSGSGMDVGLPAGQMGNSEVGHMHIGAGRVIYQDLTRINQAIRDKSFNTNPTLLLAMATAREKKRSLHIMGLLSEGGVHSHQDQFHALITMAAEQHVAQVFIHAFLDGRDCPPKSAASALKHLSNHCATQNCGKIVSLCGRYYAMDRDQRWQRTQLAYDLLTAGKADYHAADAQNGLALAYARGETDEFVLPTIIGEQATVIAEDDVVICMNFRADRVRQITRALVESDFTGFTRKQKPALSHMVSLTQYAEDIATEIAFPPNTLTNVLGDVFAQHHLTQLRVAETEKYAHVTFFFNGGRERPFPGEDRCLIPSPKEVATYDLKPEMSAHAITDAMVKAIKGQEYDVIISNFANPDMVGHTGNFAATMKAVETIDACLGRLIAAIHEVGGEMLITADHGNAELMFNPETQQAHTAHTNLPVPLVYLGRSAEFDHEPANLADIAPTILAILGIAIPPEMTGRNLLPTLAIKV